MLKNMKDNYILCSLSFFMLQDQDKLEHISYVNSYKASLQKIGFSNNSAVGLLLNFTISQGIHDCMKIIDSAINNVWDGFWYSFYFFTVGILDHSPIYEIIHNCKKVELHCSTK
jgi:hypothetical protein